MKTLASASDIFTLRARLASLNAVDTPRWGSMTVNGMICHLTDSFRLPLGELQAAPIKPAIPIPILKWVALRAPIPWAHNFPTTPEMKQGLGGTPPTAFQVDHANLLKAYARFVTGPNPCPNHPIFGFLTAAEWLRWGYLHADHHLRQFNR